MLSFLKYKPQFLFQSDEPVYRYIRVAHREPFFGHMSFFLNSNNNIYQIDLDGHKCSENIKRAFKCQDDVIRNLNITNALQYIDGLVDADSILVGEIVQGPNCFRFNFN